VLTRLRAARAVLADGAGTHFAVWAPERAAVRVVGDFNGWRPDAIRSRRGRTPRHLAAFVPGVKHGALYKYHIESRHSGYTVQKADPYAFAASCRRAPHRSCGICYTNGAMPIWNAPTRTATTRPTRRGPSIEVHMGSWRACPKSTTGSASSYRELAHALGDYW
jgi:1,4-alpha-glucan branching enzyme